MNMTTGNEKLELVEGANDLNDLIKEINQMTEQWDEIYTPIVKYKTACLKAAGLEKVQGAEVKHVIIGMIVLMVTEKNMTLDDIKRKIVITPDEMPFIKITEEQKHETILKALAHYLKVASEGKHNVMELKTQIEEIPSKASEIAKSAPTDYVDLEFMEKAKMIKMTMANVSRCKD